MVREMLPVVNGKSFLELTETDLRTLIDNADFRENDYIDYKQNFAFLEIPKDKKSQIAEKIAEFRSDVCAFANAEGGFLVFGVSDENGCVSDIPGICIPNDDTDRFELDRRNNLIPISPKTPYLKFHFIKLENQKYVIIIWVKHDNFAPYTHVVDEKNYNIYKRCGNRKQIISYSELKNMFNQSLSLDKEIYKYRSDRIKYYQGMEDDDYHTYSQFLMLHIIPETFMDSSYDERIFILEKSKKYNFSRIFSHFNCSSQSIPCVDGIRFVGESRLGFSTEGFIYNNKIVECFFPLRPALNIGHDEYPNGYIAWKYLWNKIYGTVSTYCEEFKLLVKNQRIFVCISIVGCKGVISTGEQEDFWNFYTSTIDRNLIMCNPVILENADTEDSQEIMQKKLYIEYMLSLGKKHEKLLDEYIKDVYY